jgi:hypothetical protein
MMTVQVKECSVDTSLEKEPDLLNPATPVFLCLRNRHMCDLAKSATLQYYEWCVLLHAVHIMLYRS